MILSGPSYCDWPRRWYSVQMQPLRWLIRSQTATGRTQSHGSQHRVHVSALQQNISQETFSSNARCAGWKVVFKFCWFVSRYGQLELLPCDHLRTMASNVNYEIHYVTTRRTRSVLEMSRTWLVKFVTSDSHTSGSSRRISWVRTRRRTIIVITAGRHSQSWSSWKDTKKFTSTESELKHCLPRLERWKMSWCTWIPTSAFLSSPQQAI